MIPLQCSMFKYQPYGITYGSAKPIPQGQCSMIDSSVIDNSLKIDNCKLIIEVAGGDA